MINFNIEDILKAIQNLFCINFPEIKTIYMEEVTDGLETPSIFIDYKILQPKKLSKFRTKIEINFSICYFLEVDLAKKKNYLTVSNIEKKIVEVLQNEVIFYEGKTYRIINLNFDKRKTEIVIMFKLTKEFKEIMPISQKISSVDLELN